MNYLAEIMNFRTLLQSLSATAPSRREPIIAVCSICKTYNMVCLQLDYFHDVS